jgi:hypothetical protein
MLPAVNHVDGTCRFQTITTENGLLFHILREFRRLTGVGLLLNTSLNVDGEPLACTPEEAYNCFRYSGLDMMLIEDCVLHIEQQVRRTLILEGDNGPACHGGGRDRQEFQEVRRLIRRASICGTSQAKGNAKESVSNSQPFWNAPFDCVRTLVVAPRNEAEIAEHLSEIWVSLGRNGLCELAGEFGAAAGRLRTLRTVSHSPPTDYYALE